MTNEESIIKSVRSLKQSLARHEKILSRALDSENSGVTDAVPSDCLDPGEREKLKKQLAEIVERLEKTRHSFKSKQIELIRKDLIKILSEGI